MLARARAEAEALEARAADAEAAEAAASAELRGAEAAAAERDAAVARAEALEQRMADLRAEQVKNLDLTLNLTLAVLYGPFGNCGECDRGHVALIAWQGYCVGCQLACQPPARLL